MSKPRTPKQARFVEEYLIDLNGKQAAIRAGIAEKNAEVQASKWLSNPKVAEEVDRLKAERSQETKIDAAWVLKRLADEATADVADLYDDNNNLKPVKEWPLIWRQGLVAGVEIDALFEGVGEDREQVGFTKKVRLSDRLKRLELIGKHIGVKAFEETINVKGLDTLADRLDRAMKRGGE